MTRVSRCEVVENAVDPEQVAALVALLAERFGVELDDPRTWTAPLQVISRYPPNWRKPVL